ncbi:hypothetical protein BJX61DRAFT_542292 [Aspergillus egyptiacus]|nr:hypothetical protein BJX61DRAFT_542292 [Aspergillus egyptiacus]
MPRRVRVPPKPQVFAAPYTVKPRDHQHTHTMILLHERGNNGKRFGRMLLKATDLDKRFPTVKFVFPSAKDCHDTVSKRKATAHWYPCNIGERILPQHADTEVPLQFQAAGLAETGRYIRSLIDREAAVLAEAGSSTTNGGYDRVVLGGLGLGGAAALFTLLGGPNRLGGFIGLDAWLPVQKIIFPALGVSQSEEGRLVECLEAVNEVRDMLALEPLEPDHGDGDELRSTGKRLEHLEVPMLLADALGLKDEEEIDDRRSLVTTMGLFGLDVSWVGFHEIESWHRAYDQTEAIVKFLKPIVDGKAGEASDEE